MRPREPISIAELRHRYLEPNFTAILPGKCQARCRFCIEPEGPPPLSSGVWLASLDALVSRELPSIFRTVSLSGGEPTLSPVFAPALEILAKARSAGRLTRVVLTTNGNVKGVTKHLDLIARAVTHINLSRHAVDDVANTRVFKTANVPSATELRELIAQLNRRGVPVNFNCVYSREHAFGHRLNGVDHRMLRSVGEQYIRFAREAGASSVVFRHDHRVWEPARPTPLEEAFDDYAVAHHAECESCRVIGKVIGGMPVNFKRSAYEPVQLHLETELYELVMHSDGVLYRDWSRQQPVQRPLPSMDYMYETHESPETRALARPTLFLEECEPRAVSCGLLSPHR